MNQFQEQTKPLNSTPLRQHDSQTDFFPFKMSLIFCACSVLTMFGSVIGVLGNTFSFSFTVFDLVISLYMLFLSCFMFVLDAPFNFVIFMELRYFVHKYMRALTRLTGRGIYYMFMGSLTYAKLFDDSMSPFLGFFLGGAVFVVGLLTFISAFMKSRKLERVRVGVKQAQLNGQSNRWIFQKMKISSTEVEFRLAAMFAQHATTNKDGLTKAEFCNNLAIECRVTPPFTEADADLIFACLCEDNGESAVMSIEDLEDFCHGPFNWL